MDWDLQTLVSDNEAPAQETAPTALVADDYASARVVLSGLMESLGYDVVAVNDGRELLKAMQDNPQTISLMIIDVDMPVMTGPEALQVLRDAQDTTPAILISGAASESLTNNLDRDTRFLRKPFSRRDLADTISDVVKADAPGP